MTNIVRTPLDSSMLASCGYDARQGVLEVEFKNGELYRFFMVPPNIGEALEYAPSKGTFFNEHIKDRYPFIELPSEITERQPADDALRAELERSVNQPREQSDDATASRSGAPGSPRHL